MKEMYEQLGISSEVYDFGKEIEASLKERFQKFDEIAEYNQMKVTPCNAEKQSQCRLFSVFFRIRI